MPILELAAVPKVIWSHSGRYFSQCKGLGVSEFIIKPASNSEMDELVGQLAELMRK